MKIKQILILLFYFAVPVIITYLFLHEKLDLDYTESLDYVVVLDFSLENNYLASIIGIFSYIWMCFNILMITRVKMIENNFSVNFIMTFHTIMAVVALGFGFLHCFMLTGLFPGFFTKAYPNDLIIIGSLGLYIFALLMLLAIIFMTNMLIKVKLIEKMRKTAYKMKFRYHFNKVLHNITIVAVFFVFIHTLLASTTQNSVVMRASYFGFFVLTCIGWISHKVVRRHRLEPNPYAHSRRDPYSKVSIRSEILEKPNNKWYLDIMEKIPSLYVCFQCGTCSDGCPSAEASNGKYNPRIIMEEVILGQQKMLVEELEPNVWLCSTCQKCVENCPQKIELTEIFTKIKNECFKRDKCPEAFISQVKMVFDNGLAIPFSNPILRRRQQLGLPEIKTADVEILQQVMKEAGLDLSSEEKEVL